MTYQVFDTTLRDGAQREGITYSVVDKLAVARLLDEFGVGFIEGGWPGAMPKDTEFFRRARTELDLKHARPGRVRRDPQGRRRGRTTTRRCGRCSTRRPRRCALVAKSDIRHVERALRTTARGEPGDGPRHRRATSCAEGRRVFLDWSTSSTATGSTRTYTAAVAATALDAGAERAVMCDTNGGMLPSMITRPWRGRRRWPTRARGHRTRP